MGLSKLGDATDVIVPKVLEAGGEVVCREVRGRLQSVIGTGTKYPSRSTGELIAALGVSRALLDRNGDYNVKIGFVEPRRDGESNAKLASVIEYGTSTRQARPFLKPGAKSARQAAVEAMERAFEEEVRKL